MNKVCKNCSFVVFYTHTPSLLEIYFPTIMSSNGIFIKYFDSKRKLKKWVRENNNKLIILHLSAFVKDNELKKWYDKIDNNPEENEKANGG